MAIARKPHSQQGGLVRAVSDDDLLIIDQPDSSTPTGWRTKTAKMSLFSNTVFTEIKANEARNILIINPNTMTGDGTVANPFNIKGSWISDNYVNASLVNVSQIGNLRQANLPMNAGGTTVNITENIPYFFVGKNGLITPRTINLRDWFASFSGSNRYFLYLTLNAGVVSFEVLNQTSAERVDYTLIATITTSGESITAIDARPFIRLDKYRISATRRGSAIPYTGSHPSNYDFTNWG